MIRPLDPVTSKQRAAYGFAFFVLFVALWAWATFGGHVSKTFLANPLTMLQEGWELLIKHGFLFDIGMTIWRVIGGFALAAIIAVPLGVLMGAYKPIEALLELHRWEREREKRRQRLCPHGGQIAETPRERSVPDRLCRMPVPPEVPALK